MSPMAVWSYTITVYVAVFLALVSHMRILTHTERLKVKVHRMVQWIKMPATKPAYP